MKKIASSLLFVLFLVASCTKQDVNEQVATSPVSGGITDMLSAPITQRSCAANDVLEAQMAADPSLRQRMQAIEDFTQKVVANPEAYRLDSKTALLTIPVIVHVVYNTADQNISDAQIQSQIDVLNEDYGNTNADKVKIPAEFSPVDGTIGVKFTLDRTIRTLTTKTSFSSNDAIKKTASGGDDAIDATKYLNIWTGNLGGGLLGYAQFPGGNLTTDGVVILYSAFGRTGNLIPTYNLGRSATHEIGHWMNLRHIWGDKKCGTDYVDDTPLANAANYGCPSYPHKSTCTGTPDEMTMNYMDYSDDACMYMFTKGQRARMKAVFSPGGPRASFVK